MRLRGGPGGYQDILHLGMVADRWVVCVYARGSVFVWDGEESGGGRPAVCQLLGRDEPWTSALAVGDGDGDGIYVAVTRVQRGYVCRSMSIFLVD